MKLRRSIGQRIVKFGMWVFGDSEITTTEVKQTLGEPLDAVVEASDDIDRWEPEQHGNVIVAEPDLMTKYRRGKL